MPEGVVAPGRVQDNGPAAGGTGFQWPEAVPWSALADEFLDEWAPRARKGEPYEGQHLEITGQSGSGKSFVLTVILHMRALLRDSATIYINTKQSDPTVARLFALGWPRAKTWDEVRRYRQCVFWPDPHGTGEAQEQAHEEAIYSLLTGLWVKESNTIVTFDEIAYAESLSRRLKKFIRQMWREARALGISIIASKQRPIGVVRDQHSESRWKIVFPPADEGDMERFSQLLGRPRDWEPVLRSLDQELHQFVIRNNVTRDSFISWVDFGLEDLPPLPKREEHTVYRQPPAA